MDIVCDGFAVNVINYYFFIKIEKKGGKLKGEKLKKKVKDIHSY